jgi:hypothetical protein
MCSYFLWCGLFQFNKAQFYFDLLTITSSQYVKSRFRSLKHDLTWLVDASLHHVFISKVGKGQPKPASGKGPGEEGSCGEVDAFITTITAILSEKLWVATTIIMRSWSSFIASASHKFTIVKGCHPKIFDNCDRDWVVSIYFDVLQISSWVWEAL